MQLPPIKDSINKIRKKTIVQISKSTFSLKQIKVVTRKSNLNNLVIINIFYNKR